METIARYFMAAGVVTGLLFLMGDMREREERDMEAYKADIMARAKRQAVEQKAMCRAGKLLFSKNYKDEIYECGTD